MNRREWLQLGAGAGILALIDPPYPDVEEPADYDVGSVYMGGLYDLPSPENYPTHDYTRKLEKLAKEINPEPLYCVLDLGWLRYREEKSDEVILQEIEQRLHDEYAIDNSSDAPRYQLNSAMRDIRSTLFERASAQVATLQNRQGKEVRILIMDSASSNKGEIGIPFGFSKETSKRLGLDSSYFLRQDKRRSLVVWHEFGHFIDRKKDDNSISYMKRRHDQEGYADTFRALMHLRERDDPNILIMLANARCLNGFLQAPPSLDMTNKREITCENIAYMTHLVIRGAIHEIHNSKKYNLQKMTVKEIAKLAEDIVQKYAYSKDALLQIQDEILRGHALLRASLGGMKSANIAQHSSRELQQELLDCAWNEHQFPAYKKAAKELGEENFLQKMIDMGVINNNMPWVKDVQQAQQEILKGTLIASADKANPPDVDSTGLLENRRRFLRRFLPGNTSTQGNTGRTI